MPRRESCWEAAADLSPWVPLQSQESSAPREPPCSLLVPSTSVREHALRHGPDPIAGAKIEAHGRCAQSLRVMFMKGSPDERRIDLLGSLADVRLCSTSSGQGALKKTHG